MSIDLETGRNHSVPLRETDGIPFVLACPVYPDFHDFSWVVALKALLDFQQFLLK